MDLGTLLGRLGGVPRGMAPPAKEGIREVRIGFFGHGKTYEIGTVDARKSESAIVIVAKTGLNVVPASEYDALADLLRKTASEMHSHPEMLNRRMRGQLDGAAWEFWRRIVREGAEAADLFSHLEQPRLGAGRTTLHEEIDAEHQFLRERQRLGHPDVGASSSALLNVALGRMDEPDRWPHDDDDLARCERTYEKAPPHLQERMRPWLEQFREHVAHKRAQREGRSFGPHGPHVAGVGAVAERMASAARQAVDPRPSAVEGVPPAPQISETQAAAERAGATRKVWDAVHRLHAERATVRVRMHSALSTGHGLVGKIVTVDDEGFAIARSTARASFPWRAVAAVEEYDSETFHETCEREEREARRAERDRQDVDLLNVRWLALKPRVPTDMSVEIPEPTLIDALKLLLEARKLRNVVKDITQLAILACLIADIERALGLEREERTMDKGTRDETRELLDGAIATGDVDEAARLARELAELHRVPDFVEPMFREERHLVGLLRQINGLDVTENTTEQLTAMVRTSVSTMWAMVSDEPLREHDTGPSAREVDKIQRLERRIADAHAELVSRSRDPKATKATLRAAIVAAVNILSGARR